MKKGRPDKDLDGKLVYLTIHVDKWLREVNGNFNVPMANRIAKVIKVFDWSTNEGRLLLKARENQGKWVNMDAKAFKFVLKVYCPDLSLGGKVGITTEEMLPRYYPGTKLTMFEEVPSWMLENFQKDESNAFSVVPASEDSGEKEKSPTKKSSKKSASKKQPAKKKAVKKKQPAKKKVVKKTSVKKSASARTGHDAKDSE